MLEVCKFIFLMIFYNLATLFLPFQLKVFMKYSNLCAIASLHPSHVRLEKVFEIVNFLSLKIGPSSTFLWKFNARKFHMNNVCTKLIRKNRTSMVVWIFSSTYSVYKIFLHCTWYSPHSEKKCLYVKRASKVLRGLKEIRSWDYSGI